MSPRNNSTEYNHAKAEGGSDSHPLLTTKEQAAALLNGKSDDEVAAIKRAQEAARAFAASFDQAGLISAPAASRSAPKPAAKPATKPAAKQPTKRF
jgi:hypothetical protein